MDYLAAPALQNLAGTQIYAAARIQTDFSFDAGGNRAKQLKKRIAADSSRELEETLYLGSYEREIHSTQANGSATPQVKKVVHRHTLGGFGVYTQTTSSTGTETKLTTILKDHLGSTDLLYTGIWNGSSFANPQTEKQAFDPWGERKNAETWQNERTVSTDAYRTSAQGYDRGYTGHEQLDDSGLIHMNGRIYDPELGRMLSPDPVVQVPEYSQNFNRYSYVMNNPMNMTDPSGFSWWNPFSVHKAIHNWAKENWRTIVVIVVVAVLTYFTAGAASAWGAGLYASATGTVGAAAGSAAATAAGAFGGAVAGGYIGAVAGGLGAALNGGNLGDVLRGALIGGVQGAITGGLLHGMEQAPGVFNAQTAMHVAGHGVVGGAANVAMGGKFGDGFLSAAVSAAGGDAGLFGPEGGGFGGMARRTIIAGVVGGTASVIGGGKFANGAYTAAFQHLLNAEAPRMARGVIAFFNKSESSLDVTDWETLKGGTLKADTGGEYNESGVFKSDGKSSIPDGRYYIVDDPKGRGGWFGLYAADDGYVDDLSTPNGSSGPQRWLQSRGLPSFGLRGQFRLHLGERSLGCVTCWINGAPKSYDRIASIIQGTRSYQVPYSAGSLKTLKVYGELWAY